MAMAEGMDARLSPRTPSCQRVSEKSRFFLFYSGARMYVMDEKTLCGWRRSSLVVSECVTDSARLGHLVFDARDMASVRHLRHCEAHDDGQLGGLRLPLHFLCNVFGRLCFRQLVHGAGRLELLLLVAVDGVETQLPVLGVLERRTYIVRSASPSLSATTACTYFQYRRPDAANETVRTETSPPAWSGWLVGSFVRSFVRLFVGSLVRCETKNNSSVGVVD